MSAFLVDARGLLCPLPVLKLAREARERPTGAVLKVWATDPAAAGDLKAWCEATGHVLLALTLDGGEVRAQIQLR
jgi:tRNA 2-thiouridine synthesizing protein A